MVTARRLKFDHFILDCDRYELARDGQTIKLEKIPMELLILLATSDGHLVTRQQIVEHLWGNDVFVDTEHGINTAIRKIRQVLRDDPEQPRFVQTVTGKGYRFIAVATRTKASQPKGRALERFRRSSPRQAIAKVPPGLVREFRRRPRSGRPPSGI